MSKNSIDISVKLNRLNLLFYPTMDFESTTYRKCVPCLKNSSKNKLLIMAKEDMSFFCAWF